MIGRGLARAVRTRIARRHDRSGQRRPVVPQVVRGNPLRSWDEYRQRQIAELQASNTIDYSVPLDPVIADLLEDVEHRGAVRASVQEAAPQAPADARGGAAPSTADVRRRSRLGLPRRDVAPPAAGAATPAADVSVVTSPGPLSEATPTTVTLQPFQVGFFGALGVLLAYGCFLFVARLDYVISLIIVAFFLTLSLNPVVERLIRWGASRGVAVLLVFLGLLGVAGALAALVIPPVVAEGTDLMYNAPAYTQDFVSQPWVRNLDHDYELTQRIQNEFSKRVNDGGFAGRIFGGVLGAGKILVSSVFSTFTVLVLTLYFMATLPAVKQAAYALVPASRRARVVGLSEEIMRRVGGYAGGQMFVATINALCSWIMMSVLGIPYAAVLAVLVGFLGLIPMVGATLGALLVAAVALSISPTTSVIVGVYYLLYQQIENYVIVPNVMKRTVSVPGAVTVVAALIGGTLFGVVGTLLAIPTAAGLLLIYEEVLVPRQRQL